MKHVVIGAILIAAGMWSDTRGGTIPAAPLIGQQPAAALPAGEVVLGTIRIPRRVLADGKPLAPGTYRVRLTGQTAQPPTTEFERWVEFLQGQQVRGREVVTIVPQADIRDVAKSAPPAAGSARVELLKGNEFVRIWIHRGGYHYLIHLPVAS